MPFFKKENYNNDSIRGVAQFCAAPFFVLGQRGCQYAVRGQPALPFSINSSVFQFPKNLKNGGNE
jgi:hypothetical protein